MRAKQKYFFIGLFVLFGMGVALFFVTLIGLGKFTNSKLKYVLYFDASISGLTVGAPVHFKGVEIGQVTDILINVDQNDLDIQIPIFVAVDEERFQKIHPDMVNLADLNPFGESDTEVIIRALVAKGLRAQLQIQSLVTGRLFIDLDFYPDTEPRYVEDYVGLPQIPTIPSEFEAITNAISELPLKDLVDKAIRTLSSIEVLTSGPEIKNLMQNLSHSSQEIDKAISELAHDSGPALKEARLVLKQLNHILGSGQAEALGDEAEGTLQALSDVARAMEMLIKEWSDHPESFIFGKSETERE